MEAALTPLFFYKKQNAHLRIAISGFARSTFGVLLGNEHSSLDLLLSVNRLEPRRGT
jgi:hypothetical protein